jgi:hypothetical protein
MPFDATEIQFFWKICIVTSLLCIAVLSLFCILTQKKVIATGISKCYVFAKVTDVPCACRWLLVWNIQVCYWTWNSTVYLKDPRTEIGLCFHPIAKIRPIRKLASQIEGRHSELTANLNSRLMCCLICCCWLTACQWIKHVLSNWWLVLTEPTD